MEKNFDFKACEFRLNGKWLREGTFHAKINRGKRPYTIIMPPPNITSRLHIGHAFNSTVTDAIIRFKRMQGFEALLLPGADHAAIATEVKVSGELAKRGIRKEDLTREEFLQEVEKWYTRYTEEISEQFKRLGLSCDWQRFTFTMEEHSKEEVKRAFARLNEAGLIYRGERMVNVCPDCGTALSDAEVEYEEVTRPIWTIRYGEIEIATTRPETLFGDVAVAVNPNDERYRHLIGRLVPLPLTGRDIPVIADESVDMKFGTGSVKITPAHDHADYEVGLRHNLKPIVIERFRDRDEVVAELEKGGFIVDKKMIKSNIGTCYRCHHLVEPTISKQWFVRMKELGLTAISNMPNILPKKFVKIYLHWLENIKDWCISRQLLSGHRIPIDGEDDVLDTWFSSALWPFLTLNRDKEEFDYFYPTQTLVTAYDIIFFWVIRMVFSGIFHTGKLPFENVLLHGLVRDSLGRKMSKSLGNGIDPIEIIDRYGADVLRYSLIVGSKLDRDPRYGEERAVKARNFTNKIWNATKFVLAHREGEGLVEINETFLKLINPIMPFITQELWEEMGHKTELAFERFPAGSKIKELNRIIKNTIRRYERFDFGVAANELQQFYWNWFCDEYIESYRKVIYKIKEKEVLVKEIDKGAETERLKREIERGEKMLGNAGFIARAPKGLIENERTKLKRNREALDEILRA
ncbi:MAG: class I tRNA ligase family protein [Christensenellaceae bacterium]|jgi:valyl-tRNA synthetase|nr:class I tRNA ligase family protein [Christensenellaceae bacterium]